MLIYLTEEDKYWKKDHKHKLHIRFCGLRFFITHV